MKIPIKKISELFSDIKIGGTPSRGNPAYFGGTNLWVSIKDMNGQPFITKTAECLTDEGVAKSNCKLIKKGSLLFSFKLTVGRVAFAGSDLYTNEAIASFDLNEANKNGIDLEYLSLVLPIAALNDKTKNSMGVPSLNKDKINDLTIPQPPLLQQIQISSQLKIRLTELQKSSIAIEVQIEEVANLANSIIFESIKKNKIKKRKLIDVMDEIKKGIGETWKDYPVMGATRNGMALAKEPPGQFPYKYKPVVPGTVFYNPMRILIGSIAFMDEGDEPGITSPDYVVLQGKEGILDSRWFYYWLRSPLGEQCINSLARGAVRERMLFNRLAEGEIELPEFSIQKSASESLKELVNLKKTIKKQLDEIKLIPNKLLAQAFNIE